MSINSMDDKFGLPNPHCQQFPKKRSMWPIFAVASAAVAVLIAAKMGYTFYLKEKGINTEQIIVGQRLGNNKRTLQSVSTTPGSLPASSKPRSGAEANKNVNQSTLNSRVNGQSFHGQKSTKVKYDIHATQERLAEKHKKPLVRPGTYQELKNPQGIYHLVVFSHLQKPAAMKVVQQFMKRKLGVCLIMPRMKKNERYYRVTIGHSKTQYEAEQKLKQFKATCKHIFILKY